MKAVPVEKINQIIGSIKSDLAIELLRAIIENHAVEINETEQHPNFVKLVERISAIDQKAADWLIENKNIFPMNKDKENKYLYGLLTWRDTPQGELYWKKISEQLGE